YDHLLNQAKGLFRLYIDGLAIGLRPGCNYQGRGRPAFLVWLAAMIEVLPELFCDKGHVWMQQAQALIEDCPQDAGRSTPRLFIALHLYLGNLHVPVTVIGPEELVDLAAGLTQLEILNQACHLKRQACQAAEYPAVCQSMWLYLVDSRNASANAGGRHQHEARGIPDFVGKVAIANDTLRDELHIVARCAARCQRKAQSISAILIHDF